jgi:chromate transporter
LIYIELFLNFLVIGAVSFGGGYGMISLVRETVLSKGWLTESQFMDFIAVSESTPGPLAVNMATFIGSSQGGILGAFTATLGVVLPSFFIILIIAAVLKNILKYAGVKAVLTGIRPCIVAMIIATAISMGLNIFIGAEKSGDAISPDIRSIIIFFILIAVQLMCGKVLKKKLSPILMIVFSAVLGIVFFGGGI